MADPISSNISDSVKARFWAKVDVRGADECWLWTGSRKGRSGHDGYGSIAINGKNRKATHVMLELTTGEPFPQGKVACHKCDNPPCVNPNHLFIGTMQDNIKDAVAKGRVKPERMLLRNHNREKQFCSRGHPYDKDNAYKNPQGSRQCRTCLQMHREAYVQRKRAVLLGRIATLEIENERLRQLLPFTRHNINCPVSYGTTADQCLCGLTEARQALGAKP